jgi:hypothetical protein
MRKETIMKKDNEQIVLRWKGTIHYRIPKDDLGLGELLTWIDNIKKVVGISGYSFYTIDGHEIPGITKIKNSDGVEIKSVRRDTNEKRY